MGVVEDHLVIAEVPYSQPVKAIAIPTQSVPEWVYRQRVVLFGWTLKETTGTAGASVVLQGSSDPTDILVEITPNPNESIRDWLAGCGLACPVGLYLNVISGSVSGAVWVRV